MGYVRFFCLSFVWGSVARADASLLLTGCGQSTPGLSLFSMEKDLGAPTLESFFSGDFAATAEQAKPASVEFSRGSPASSAVRSSGVCVTGHGSVKQRKRSEVPPMRTILEDVPPPVQKTALEGKRLFPSTPELWGWLVEKEISEPENNQTGLALRSGKLSRSKVGGKTRATFQTVASGAESFGGGIGGRVVTDRLARPLGRVASPSKAGGTSLFQRLKTWESGLFSSGGPLAFSKTVRGHAVQKNGVASQVPLRQVFEVRIGRAELLSSLGGRSVFPQTVGGGVLQKVSGFSQAPFGQVRVEDCVGGLGSQGNFAFVEGFLEYDSISGSVPSDVRIAALRKKRASRVDSRSSRLGFSRSTFRFSKDDMLY